MIKKLLFTLFLLIIFSSIANAQVFPSRANNYCMDSSATYFASSTIGSFGFSINAAFDGDRRGVYWGNPYGQGGGWNDGTVDSWPDYIGCNFGRTKSVARAVVTTFQDNFSTPREEPYLGLIVGHYGIETYSVQVLDTASTWITVASTEDSDDIIKVFEFFPVSASACRLKVDEGYGGYSRVVEFECGGVVP